jgi:hypothetical protein
MLELGSMVPLRRMVSGDVADPAADSSSSTAAPAEPAIETCSTLLVG